MDTAKICPNCGAELSASGTCVNFGACFTADREASRGARGATVKAPQAWTIRGNVD